MIKWTGSGATNRRRDSRRLVRGTWNNERMRQIRIAVLLLLLCGCSGQSEVSGEWISLFDGESLEGWTASENRETFRVEDGLIVVHGPRSHLFYTGPVADHDFKNFALEVEVLTTPGSNSGIYFHTEFQDEGWPARGYEAQVNNSHTDPRLTGSLYGIEDVLEKKVRDNEWFVQRISVRDRRILIQVKRETVIDYTEPEDPQRPEDMGGRLLSSGTIALQGHDPGSKVFYREVRIKLLD